MGETPENSSDSFEGSETARMVGEVEEADSLEEVKEGDELADLEELIVQGGTKAGLAMGASDQAVAANTALISLDRAARSFTLYDPTNSAVASFLESIEVGFRDYLASYGAMDLQVLPFELRVDEEVVYEQTDREQSLAFKLFRDGVRRLVIAKGVEWSELLRLLEILSVRYSGVRVNEDDVVTLLWKAGFKAIEVDAVEGFVADDEEVVTEEGMSEEELAEALNQLLESELDWQEEDSNQVTDEDDEALLQELLKVDLDSPLTELPAPAVVEYQFVDDDDLEELLLEDGGSGLGQDCLNLVSSLLELDLYGDGHVSPDEFMPLILEVRDFCLTQGQLTNLIKLLELLTDYAFEMDEDHVIHAVLQKFANAFALGRLVRSLPSSAQHPPPTFYTLLSLLPGEHVSVLLSLLGEIRTAHARRILRQLLEHFGVDSAELIVESMRGATGPVAADLLRVLEAVDNDRAMQMLSELASSEDNEVRLQCFHMMEAQINRPEVRPVVHQALNFKDEIFRVRALELLCSRGDRRDFPYLLRHILGHALNLSDLEAEASGRAMATVDPKSALEVFTEWIKPKGLFGKLKPVQRGQDVCAIAGLTLITDELADELLQRLSKRSGEKVHRLCVRARITRHRLLSDRKLKHSSYQTTEGSGDE